jgi:hypothetical protein
MGKLGRAIAAGVAGGLSELGAGMKRKEEQERVDERLAKEDQFKERQLSIQEKDAALRADQAKTQKFFDNVKMNQIKLTKQLAGSAGNLNIEADAFTKHFKDQRIYKNDPARAEAEGAFAVFQISFLDQDPITGEVKVDPLTGLPTEIRSSRPAGRERIFKTKGDYQAFRATVSNPEIAAATALQNLTAKQALENQEKMLDMLEGTDKGKREAAATKASTDLDVAKAERLRAEVESGVFSKDKKAVGSVMGLDGKDVKLSTPEVNQLINDTKSMKDKYPGINSGEAYRLSEAMESPARVHGLQALAQLVVDEKEDKQKAIAQLQSSYRLTKQTATDLLAEQMLGLTSKKPGFFDNWIGRNKEALTEAAPPADQSLTDEARDFD